MSRRIGDMMARISHESTISDPTDVITVSELAIEELPEVEVEEVDNSVEELEAIAGAAISLERNLQHINSLVDQGIGLEPSMVQQWQDSITSSMEAFGIPKEIYEEGLASVQLSFENNSSEDYSPEALDKIKATIARLWELFLAALKRAATWVVNKLKGDSINGEKLIKAGEALVAAAKKIETNGLDLMLPSHKEYAYLMCSSTSFDPEGSLKRTIKYEKAVTEAAHPFYTYTTTTSDDKLQEVLEPLKRQWLWVNTLVSHLRTYTVGSPSKVSTLERVKVIQNENLSAVNVPTEIKALTKDEIIRLGEEITTAGVFLRDGKQLAAQWAKAPKVTLPDEYDEETIQFINKANEFMAVGISLLGTNSHILSNVAKAAYKFGSESLKAQVKAN